MTTELKNLATGSACVPIALTWNASLSLTEQQQFTDGLFEREVSAPIAASFVVQLFGDGAVKLSEYVLSIENMADLQAALQIAGSQGHVAL